MTEKTLKQLLSNGESESNMTREKLADVLGKSPNTIKEHIATVKKG